MLLGVILFTLSTSVVLEFSITDSMNIHRSIENEAMIEKLTYKYSLKGESKKYLS